MQELQEKRKTQSLCGITQRVHICKKKRVGIGASPCIQDFAFSCELLTDSYHRTVMSNRLPRVFFKTKTGPGNNSENGRFFHSHLTSFWTFDTSSAFYSSTVLLLIPGHRIPIGRLWSFSTFNCFRCLSAACATACATARAGALAAIASFPAAAHYFDFWSTSFMIIQAPHTERRAHFC